MEPAESITKGGRRSVDLEMLTSPLVAIFRSLSLNRVWVAFSAALVSLAAVGLALLYLPQSALAHDDTAERFRPQPHFDRHNLRRRSRKSDQ